MTINLTFVVLMAIVLIYFVLLRILDHLEKEAVKNQSLTDEACLSMMAWKRGCSEYDIFKVATKHWQVPKEKAEKDFNDYLTKGEFPYYVRDYIRRHRKEVDNLE